MTSCEPERDPTTLTINSSAGNVVAKVPHQDFRAWFYLLTGKPDSKIKLFTRAVIASPSDIHDLNSRVRAKLNNHNIKEIVSTVSIQFDGKGIVQFGSWPEFHDFNWKIPEKTESVTVKWEFLIDTPGFEMPQRHTLLVKLSTPVSP